MNSHERTCDGWEDESDDKESEEDEDKEKEEDNIEVEFIGDDAALKLFTLFTCRLICILCYTLHVRCKST